MSLATIREQPRPLAQRDDPAGPLLRRLCELDVAICVVPLGRLGRLSLRHRWPASSSLPRYRSSGRPSQDARCRGDDLAYYCVA